MNHAAGRRVLSLFAVLTICAGIGVRAYLYSINRSLWLDEAMLANNIVARTFMGLLQPLDDNQGAPVGFLLVDKAVIRLVGTQDYTLRIVPFLAGAASVPLAHVTGKRYLRALPALIATALFSVSWPLIYYSTELKQYSSDVFFALLLLFLAAPCFEADAALRSYALLGVTGLVSIWLSHASVFVFASIWCVLTLWLLLRGDRTRLLWSGVMGCSWGVDIAVVYWVTLKSLAANNHLLEFWQSGFAPLPPWKNPTWYYVHLGRALASIAYLPTNMLTLASVVVGIVSLGAKDWARTLVLVGPFLLTLATSATGKYPFEDRLILFLVPLLFMFLAEGIERVGSLVSKWNAAAAVLVVAAGTTYFLYYSGRIVYPHIAKPPMGEDIKPVLAFLDRGVRADDFVYVSAGAVPAFRFYAPFYGLWGERVVLGVNSRRDPNGYLVDIKNRVGEHDCWFLFSHACPNCQVDEQRYILAYLDGIGTRHASYSATGASVYYYGFP